MHIVFFSFLAFWVALLPIYLWGYGVTLFFHDTWNRGRFFLGIAVGSVSLMVLFFLEKYHHIHDILSLILMTWFIIFLYGMILILSFFWPRISRVFLRKIAFQSGCLIFFLILISTLLSFIFSAYSPITVFLTSFFLGATLEEWAKHLSSLGLLSRDFHFSQKDIIFFTFFSVLGFIFAENLLYLILGNFSLETWVWRSFVSLVIHIFSAGVCAFFWWRSLSYTLFSPRSIITFFLGVALASLIHASANLLLSSGHVFWLFVFFFFGYILFSRYIAKSGIMW